MSGYLGVSNGYGRDFNNFSSAGIEERNFGVLKIKKSLSSGINVESYFDVCF